MTLFWSRTSTSCQCRLWGTLALGFRSVQYLHSLIQKSATSMTQSNGIQWDLQNPALAFWPSTRPLHLHKNRAADATAFCHTNQKRVRLKTPVKISLPRERWKRQKQNPCPFWLLPTMAHKTMEWWQPRRSEPWILSLGVSDILWAERVSPRQWTASAGTWSAWCCQQRSHTPVAASAKNSEVTCNLVVGTYSTWNGGRRQ